MRSEDIAWAAGLFEGEGCFFVSERAAGRIVIGVTLSTTDEDVLNRFREVVQVGRVRGPIKDMRGSRKPLYQWRVQSKGDVAYVIERFLPYLGNRRRGKALEVLRAAELMMSAPQDRTHCPSGHEYTAENVMIVRTGDGSYRKCRVCWNAYKRRLASRKRNKALS